MRPPFKIHGGKHYLASWIIENFPKDYEKMDYIEPYCGAASVLLNKIPSENLEVINDLDKGVVRIFKALRDEPKQMIGKLKKIKYSERVFNNATKKTEFKDHLEEAINEFILRRMSRGGLKENFGWSDRERGGKPGDVNAWETIIKQLPLIAKRIENVYILHKPAIEVLKAFDEKNALCYVDPPYLPDTRESKDIYEVEMNTDEHINLANVLTQYTGKVIISGYSSPLYKRLYKGWKCVTKKIPNHASQKKIKPIKTECIWMNYS